MFGLVSSFIWHNGFQYHHPCSMYHNVFFIIMESCSIVWMYQLFFIHQPMDIPVIYTFYLLCVMPLYLPLQVFGWLYASHLFCRNLFCNIAESYLIFNIFRNWQFACQGGCSCFLSHKQGMRVLVSSHPQKHLFSVSFFFLIFYFLWV